MHAARNRAPASPLWDQLHHQYHTDKKSSWLIFFFFLFQKVKHNCCCIYSARLTAVLCTKALHVPKAFSDGVVVCCNYTQMASDWGVVVFVKNRWLDGLRLTLPMFCWCVRNHPKRNNNNNQFRCKASARS